MENQLRLGRKNSALVAADLTRELIDDNLMQKYGTSLDINMGREYQKYLDQKYHTLSNEFARINKNEDDYITFDELVDFVNNYSKETGHVYDQEYISKLFTLIDKNEDKQLSIQEFVEAYIKLEERLRFKKITLTKLEEELRAARDKYEKGMNDNRNEKTNKDGMTENATLLISLINAADLKPLDYNGASDPYVIFTLGDKKEVSTYKSATLDPVWNEDFSFPVSKMDSVLEVQVWNSNFGGDELHGTVKIPVIALDNQVKVEKEYNLVYKGESQGYGQIILRLHFLYSRYKYYYNNFVKTEAQIKRLQEDITELNRLFELFEKPFGILLYGEISLILDKNILQRSEDYASYAASNRKSIYYPNMSKSMAPMALKVENVIKATLKTNTIQWSRLSLIFMYLFVILSCLSLIQRSDFVGLTLSVAIWILFIRDKKIDVVEYVKYFIFTLIGNLVYDFLWIYLNYNNFWKNTRDNVEGGLKAFSYFFSFANFICKILLLVALWIQFDKAHMTNKANRKSTGKFPENKSNTINNNAQSQFGNSYMK